MFSFIIEQKDILFIKRMNLYFREELQSGGFFGDFTKE